MLPGNTPHLFSHDGENSPKQQDNNRFPFTSAFQISYSCIQLLEPKFYPELEPQVNRENRFVFIFPYSVVEESTLGEWENWVWGLIDHITKTCFSASLSFSNYFHYSLFTFPSYSHYVMTTMVVIFIRPFPASLVLVAAASSVFKLYQAAVV